ncbi:MAG: hypothetical protein ACXVA9_01615 [Bdellovibrionales bacterium]
MARLNLFFKRLALLSLAFLYVPLARAINVHALYTASCQREIGIILSVSPRQISLLNLDGNIVKVERYDVIYYATFPLDVVPITEVKNPEDVPLVEIKTFENGDLARLVRGWPVDFSQDKIAFLDLRGSEVVIDRTSIWQVDHDSDAKEVKFTARPGSRYEFVHPYAFSSCTTPAVKGSTTVKVFPQQLLSDPVSIKREFDRLAAGHAQVRKYESAEQFYAIPALYSNETSLGMWLETGDRYGSSNNRKSNFTPLLTNEFSSGPFGFQSIFRSGSGPLLQSFHEEAQTQVYYRLKADYFHFSAMVDPNLLLVGSKYKWAAPDMSAHDIRANESALMEFGFDYEKFALELYLGGAASLGAREGDLFKQNNVGVPRVGLRYQNHSWLLNLMGGAGSRDGFTLSFIRANVEWLPNDGHRFVVSAIQRMTKYSGPDENINDLIFSTQSNSNTLAGYAYWKFKTRYWFGLMASIESLTLKYGAPDMINSEKHTYPKGGAMISLSF